MVRLMVWAAGRSRGANRPTTSQRKIRNAATWSARGEEESSPEKLAAIPESRFRPALPVGPGMLSGRLVCQQRNQDYASGIGKHVSRDWLEQRIVHILGRLNDHLVPRRRRFHMPQVVCLIEVGNRRVAFGDLIPH
jgi:hypothetical protein